MDLNYIYFIYKQIKINKTDLAMYYYKGRKSIGRVVINRGIFK